MQEQQNKQFGSPSIIIQTRCHYNNAVLVAAMITTVSNNMVQKLINYNI